MISTQSKKQKPSKKKQGEKEHATKLSPNLQTISTATSSVQKPDANRIELPAYNFEPKSRNDDARGPIEDH